MATDPIVQCLEMLPNSQSLLVNAVGGLGLKFLFNAYRAVLEGMLFLIVSLKVEQSLSPRTLTLMTMEGSFDLQTLFAR